MNVSADAPSIDLVYKMVDYGGHDVLKLSKGKETWIGAKAVHRRHGPDGAIAGDALALRDEDSPDGYEESLLHPVMRDGRLIRPHPPISALRTRCAAQISALPAGLRRLRDHGAYEVRVTDALRERQARARLSIL
jgi:nicotinate phosphoribosyltransferase